MTFPIVSADSIALSSKSDAPTWPIEKLKVNDAFVIPMSEGRDEHGRKGVTIRTRTCQIARNLGIKVSVRKTLEGNLAVLRVE